MESLIASFKETSSWTFFKQIENQRGVIIAEEIFNLEEITQQLEMMKVLLSLLLLCLYFHR